MPVMPETGIGRALEFLRRGQLPSGQFRVEFTLGEPGSPEASVTPDGTPFATSHIVHSLASSSSPVAREMVAHALGYLKAQRIEPGVWRYWNRDTANHGVIPPDVDDTACISWLLACHDGRAPDNVDLLLLNRDHRGLFYTWIIPRPVATTDARYWRLVLGDLNPARAWFFWRRTEARPGDVDAVVNANVLLYIGERAETEPVIEHLVRIVREGREEGCDKWYLDRYALYYAIARNLEAGIARFGELGAIVRARIAATARGDGCIGAHELHTALAARALMAFGDDSPLLDGAIEHLRRTQGGDGGWPSRPFYWGGPKALSSWGSRELTTGFCVEALERYHARGASGDRRA
jgi:hypothetical protein